MRDPHVVALYYHLETDETLRFDTPPPVEDETEAFHMQLIDGIATFRMKQHHSSVESAQKPVDEYIRAWSITAALEYGRPSLRFVYDKPELIDRAPSRPGEATITVSMPRTVATATSVALVVTRRNYPKPPIDFRASWETDTLWSRYERYIEGREPLASVGYFCLSVLQYCAYQRDPTQRQKVGNMLKAAEQYCVDYAVLEMLGKLSSEVGDEQSARKLESRTIRRPLTSEEIMWLEAVLKKLIRRAGEYAFNPIAALPQLTMDDFPPLPEEAKKLW